MKLITTTIKYYRSFIVPYLPNLDFNRIILPLLCQDCEHFLRYSEIHEKGCDTIFNDISKLDNVMVQIVANNLTQKKKNRFL
jgi:fibrillarin-like rRNA methylase